MVAKNTRMNFCFFALLFCLFVCLFKVGNQTGQVENPHPPVYACELLYQLLTYARARSLRNHVIISTNGQPCAHSDLIKGLCFLPKRFLMIMKSTKLRLTSKALSTLSRALNTNQTIYFCESNLLRTHRL